MTDTEAQLADDLSREWYGKPFYQLEDDGEEQDHIMGLVTSALETKEIK